MADVGVTRELFDLARAGDRNAYDQLFEHVAPRLLHFVRMRMGPRLRNKIDPIDALQEVYLLAHRDFARFAPEGEQAFTRWLYTIANNCLRNQASYFAAAKRTPPGLVRGTGLFDRLRASSTGPATAFVLQESLAQLREAMQHLEELEEEVVILRYFQDLKVDAIAEIVGKSPATVKRALASASRKLGSRLNSGGA